VKTSVARLSLLRYTVAPSTWSSRIVGSVPRTCSAKFGHLMTSTLETSESMMSEVRDELSSDRALALPLMRMVVFLQREMRTEWLISASISRVSPCESKLSYPILVHITSLFQLNSLLSTCSRPAPSAAASSCACSRASSPWAAQDSYS
jgi:hypothetical protein